MERPIKEGMKYFLAIILVCNKGLANNKISLETEVTKKIDSKLSVGVNTEYLSDFESNEFKVEPSLSFQLFPYAKIQVKYANKVKTENIENKLSLKLSVNF